MLLPLDKIELQTGKLNPCGNKFFFTFLDSEYLTSDDVFLYRRKKMYPKTLCGKFKWISQTSFPHPQVYEKGFIRSNITCE